jgi:hypothetical protein
LAKLSAAQQKVFAKLVKEFDRLGLLLTSDPKFPSVISTVAGGPIKGSWWAPPWGEIIFVHANALGEYPDGLLTKLISGKVTFVHRRLWPAIFAIGRARQPWQMKNLSPLAAAVLDKLDEEGELQTDWMIAVGGYESKALTKATNELETKLLVYAEQVHTDKGKHAKKLETWSHWAKRVEFKPTKLDVEKAKSELEKIVDDLNAKFGAKGKLPWR